MNLPCPPYLLRIVCFFALGFGTIVCTTTSALSSLVGPEADLVQRVNQVRRDHGLIPLRGSQELGRVARAHAEDMARNRYMGHVNRAGQNPLDRARAAGVTGFRLLAENLASSSASGDRTALAIEEWLRSPEHRRNLLHPAFNTTGVAIVPSPDDGPTIFVQLFATY